MKWKGMLMKDLVERQAVLDLIHENWYASNEFYLKQIEGLPGIDVPEDDEEFQRELWDRENKND